MTAACAELPKPAAGSKRKAAPAAAKPPAKKPAPKKSSRLAAARLPASGSSEEDGAEVSETLAKFVQAQETSPDADRCVNALESPFSAECKSWNARVCQLLALSGSDSSCPLRHCGRLQSCAIVRICTRSEG